jgi:hypothetical protein
MLRRVLLSSMALVSEGIQPVDIPDLLDETAFDDCRRTEVHTIASKFLHIDSAKTIASSE